MFAKKNTQIDEQVFEEITDEQLSQVTGGSLLGQNSVGNGSTLLGSVTGTLTGTVSQVLNVTGVNTSILNGGVGISPELGVGSLNANTPTSTQGGLL